MTGRHGGRTRPRVKVPPWVGDGTHATIPKSRATGNRKTLVWLPPVLLAAAATQSRPIGVRRYLYLIINPPPTPAGRILTHLVALTDAKRELRLVADQDGNIPTNAKEWAEERIGATLADMREQGFLDPRRLLDNRTGAIEFAYYDDADGWLQAIEAEAADIRMDRQLSQPRRYECWTEAEDTMTDLRAVCEPKGVPLYSSSGNQTVGLIDRLGRRIVADTLARPHPTKPETWLARETVIIYIGDGDPPGMAIPDKIERGAVWAHRWWREWQYRRHGLDRARAWTAACLDAGDDPGPFKVTVHRVAVTFDDLDRPGTSTVSEAVARQYRRWWPADETRTLQVEGLSVEEVVARVRDALDDLFDPDALQDDEDREATERERAADRIRRAMEPDDDDFYDDEPDDHDFDDDDDE